MNDVQSVYLIYSSCVAEQLDSVLSHPFLHDLNIILQPVKAEECRSLHVDEDRSHALLWLSAEDYPLALQTAYEKEMSVGFLPLPKGERCQFINTLSLPAQFDDCLRIALSGQPKKLDLICCNDEVVVNGVNLVNQMAMAEYANDSEARIGMHRFGFQLKRVFHAFSLTPHPVTLETAKEKSITTAITGMVLLDLHHSGALFRQFKDSVSLNDSKLSVVLFAPQSILSFLKLSFPSLLPTKENPLTQQLGYIRSTSLHIHSPVDTHYIVNQRPLTTQSLHLECLPEGLNANVSEAFLNRQPATDERENVSCDRLPQQEERVKYLSKTLPFFSHALESDFKDLFLSLKDSAQLSNTFVLLMTLSTLLATIGLFLNSASVVIGAMVLAPLMSPIISLSMGVLRSDWELSRKALGTLGCGIGLVVLLSAGIAALMPLSEITSEIAGRLNPSTLDMLVAILSGIAGALANARENIAKSLPGVSIAVALVPPLCVSGIGIGWQDMAVFSGALLLFLTNLAGIILAAGVTFMVMGFAPFKRAQKGIVLSIILVAAVSVPLYFSFNRIVKTAEMKASLRDQAFVINQQRYRLQNITLQPGETLAIHADLIGTQLPSAQTLATLKRQLTRQLGQPVSVDFAVRLVTQN